MSARKYDAILHENWHCEYCGVDLLESLHLSYTKHLDHLVPWSMGGPTDYENLVGSCFVCNGEKRCYMPTGATREQKLQDARAWLKPRVEKARLDYAGLVKKVRETNLKNVAGVSTQSRPNPFGSSAAAS